MPRAPLVTVTLLVLATACHGGGAGASPSKRAQPGAARSDAHALRTYGATLLLRAGADRAALRRIPYAWGWLWTLRLEAPRTARLVALVEAADTTDIGGILSVARCPHRAARASCGTGPHAGVQRGAVRPGPWRVLVVKRRGPAATVHVELELRRPGG